MNAGLCLTFRNRRRLTTQVLALLVVCEACDLRADDWPQYRGPSRNGVTGESAWSAEWPADGPPVVWRAKVGLGFSSVVVAKGRAFTAGHDAGRDTVQCFDAVTGKTVWKQSYPSELGDKYFEGGTTGSPTVDGDRVYWLGRWGDLFCFRAADGGILWKLQLTDLAQAPVPTWGFTGAPLVHENLLLLNVGEAGLALEKESGKRVWSSAPKDAGYSTPLPVKRGNEWVAILGNSESYLAVNIKTGQEAWRFRWVTEYGVNAADPIVSGDQVFLSTGYGKGAALLNVASGTPEVIWKSKVLRTQLNPAVLVEGHLYGADGDTTGQASLKCVELATGAEKWSQANFGSGGVIVAGGKLLALSGSGELIVAPATPAGFRPVSRAQVLGGKCWTAPVLANGLIYCRNSRGDLAVVDVRKK
ncbi:MAG TPA: alcohol dehydrogenase [Verrucomicrobiales bacterium]|nr:alcohol dehydrogenase [Verrucomicrobiales bacterium]